MRNPRLSCSSVAAVARERLPWADDNSVRPGVGAKRVQRLHGRDTEAAALSRREAPEASVTAELAAFLVEDRAVALVQSLASEKVPVVGAREEARLLALRPARGLEPGCTRLGASLGFALVPEREPQ